WDIDDRGAKAPALYATTFPMLALFVLARRAISTSGAAPMSALIMSPLNIRNSPVDSLPTSTVSFFGVRFSLNGEVSVIKKFRVRAFRPLMVTVHSFCKALAYLVPLTRMRKPSYRVSSPCISMPTRMRRRSIIPEYHPLRGLEFFPPRLFSTLSQYAKVAVSRQPGRPDNRNTG